MPLIEHLINAITPAHVRFNITTRNDRGHTALAIACLDEEADIAKLLLDCGSQPNISEYNNEGKVISLVPRLVRSPTAREYILPLLIKYGLRLNATDDLGMTPLHILARQGEGNLVEELIRLGADPNTASRNTRETVFHIAVSRSDDHLLRQVLSSPAKLAINAKNSSDQTALYIAACKANYEACGLMLQHGVDVDMRCQASEDHPEGFTALQSACYHGLTQIVKLLIAAGANKEALSNGATPLHIAASKGHLDVCRTLVLAGAEVAFKRTNNDSVIDAAIRSGNSAFSRYLTQKKRPRTNTDVHDDFARWLKKDR
jgi:ankyrin repeat protein